MHKLTAFARRCLQTAKYYARRMLNCLSDVLNHCLSDRIGYRQILRMIEQVPQSNGSRIFVRENVRVGIVADPFVLENFEPTCHLIPLTPENWQSQIPDLDCILVVSAWKGAEGEWTGLAKHESEISKKLIQLMQGGKQAKLPVLFYSKEDPPNYQHFLPYAQQADYIFTSAQESVARYQQDCPGIPVQVLTFAVNPLLHNPIGSEGKKKENTVFFAGSWMPKYPERIRTQQLFFTWIRRAGMKFSIADRNFDRKDFRYRYPLKYLPRVMAGFSYHQVSSLYKIFPWIMNFNSVSHSQTMFAMRVYDACACGAHVISNESPGMQRLFPEVAVIRSYEDLHNAVTKPAEQLTREKMQAIRRILAQDTVYHRMRQMLQTAGIPVSDDTLPLVGVLLDPQMGESDRIGCRAMFAAQSWDNKLLAENPEDLSACQILTIWGPDRIYDTYYLEDMVNGFKYTDCDYITKYSAAGKTPQRQYEYTDRILDRYATVFWATSVTINELQNFGEEEIKIPNGFISDALHYDSII